MWGHASMQQRESPIEAADIDRRRVTGQLDASGREKVTASTQHGIAFGPHFGWYPPAISESFLDLNSCCFSGGIHPLFPRRFSISKVVVAIKSC
jgi:hypothetical protein